MIKDVTIDDFYGRKQTDLFIKNEVTLLTGDNGSGKTTLLNLLYNVLSGEFIALFNIKFKKIKVDFEDNKRNLKQIIVTKEKSKISINYIAETDINIFVEKNPFSNIYEFKYVPLNELGKTENPDEDDDDDDDLFWRHINPGLKNLINKHPELYFINELKDSILYFPTFRRIESDLKILKQSTSIIYDDEINLEFKDTRIVMGVNNDEINSIYNAYSDKIRKFNSEGLNELLKKFIKNLISSIDIENKENKEKPKITDYNLAVENLIDLVDKLGINDGINKEGIKNYFKEYESKVNEVTQINSKFDSIKESDNSKTKSRGKTGKEFIEILEQLNVLLKITKLDKQNIKLIFDLIYLYGDHLNEQESILEPVKYLKRSLTSFFKDKLELIFDEKNYSLSLSTDFDLLSTGEKQLITLLSFISLAMSDSIFKRLVIIDEPELSLHISWQKKILPNLLELKENTYLIATHSPYIANINYLDSVKQLGVIDEYK